MNRVRNEEVNRSAGLERELACGVDQRALRRLDTWRKGVDGVSKWMTNTG